MRYSLRKLRRKLTRLERDPPPGGKLNDAVQRYMTTGELPRSDRFLQRVAQRSAFLAQIQMATCVPPHRDAEVMHALARHFTPPKDVKGARCRELVERVAVMLSRNVDADEIDQRIEAWVKGKPSPELLRTIKGVALPLAFLIQKGVVRVACDDFDPLDDA